MITKRTLGIASIPNRKESLILALRSIIGQVDEVICVLNDYDSVPEEIQAMKNVNTICMSNSFYGDGAKMFMSDMVEGYYITWDDDLKMPCGLVDYLQKGVQRYNAVVSLHGKYYTPPITHFKRWTHNYRVLNTVEADAPVNLIGSGCAMWHTDRLKMSIKEVKAPNMCDVWLSCCALKQHVPMYVLKHKMGYVEYLSPSGATIWQTTRDYSLHVSALNSCMK